jgi:urea transporter
MSPKSASALVWTAGILIVLGLLILSPTGAFALQVLAALCAAIPALFATQRPRLISLALLLAAVALAASFYPAFARERAAYVHHAREHSPNP